MLLLSDDISIDTHRLRCPLEEDKNKKIFFSLVDYRNSLFSASELSSLVEFYAGFKNREQLIKWMSERPKGVANIYEVTGNNEIVVVIPTSNFQGEYAKICRDEIFRGYHIVFVESGGMDDFYFNLAHNFNVGFKKALEYNPKWIIFSNDDMYKIDEPEKILLELDKLNNHETSMVFTKEVSKYHSANGFLVKKRAFRRILFYLINENRRIMSRIQNKFKVSHFIFSELNFVGGFLYSRVEPIRLGIDFCIVSSELARAKNGSLMDETYINHLEDSDLSMEISRSHSNTAEIDYRIGDLIGSTMGTGYTRMIKSIASEVYFNKKWNL